MFLSRKTIFVVIALAVLAFIALLVIQVIWIQRSVALNRQQFASRMIVVQKHIQESFMSMSKPLIVALTAEAQEEDLFTGNTALAELEALVRRNVDSVFKKDQVPLAYTLYARADTICYIHTHERWKLAPTNLSESAYLVCLCNYIPSYHSLDVGFTVQGVNEYLVKDTSGLVIPSLILIALLITLFGFIIVIINRQKTLAELKTDFINNLTHEFKTPIFSIGLTSKLLAKSPAIAESEKLSSYVDLITAENARLQSQVDKILQMSAIESGNLVPDKKPVDVHHLIEKNIATFRPAIEERGGAITFHAGAAKHIVPADELHLSGIISNLLDNAYKYSGKVPSITVSTANENGKLRLEVTDAGIGMDENALQMIFDKFYRVRKGDVHDVKGFGLGLSYVKRMVELHGGEIKVKSKPGEGTTFIILLPPDHS